MHSPRPYNFKVKSIIVESISPSNSLGRIIAEIGCSNCRIYGLVTPLGDSSLALTAWLPLLIGRRMHCGGFDWGTTTWLPLTELRFLPRLALGRNPPWMGALLVRGGKADRWGFGMESLLIGGTPHPPLVVEKLSSWIMCDSMWLTRDRVLVNTLEHKRHAIYWLRRLGHTESIPCMCKAAALPASQPNPAMQNMERWDKETD